MGNYDGNKDNDLIPRGSNISLSVNSSQEEIFHKFGKTWRTKAEDSLFFYPGGGAWIDFNDLNFIPKFLPKEIPQNVRNTCSSGGKLNENCAYDLINTNNEKLASSSKETQEAGEKLASEVSNNIPRIKAFKEDGKTNFTILECQVDVNCTFTLVGEDEDSGDTIVFDSLSVPQNSKYYIDLKNQANKKRVAVVNWLAESLSPNATDTLM